MSDKVSDKALLDLREESDKVNQQYRIVYEREVPGNRIGRFFRRWFMNFASFLLQPLVTEQERFNETTVRCINKELVLSRELHRRVNDLEDVDDRRLRPEQLKRLLSDREELIDQLVTRTMVLEERVESLERELAAKAASDEKPAGDGKEAQES